MRLEPTKFERLKAEIEGSEEYLEEERERAERHIQKFKTSMDAYKKQYLEQQIRFLAKEEERTIEKIEDLEERLSKEKEPREIKEPVEISSYKAGKLGVTRGLASIGLSWKDIAEVCDDYDSLLGGGVPPAIYDKDSSKASKGRDQIKIEGRRRDVEIEKQIEKEKSENDKRQEAEQKEVEEQSSKVDETIEQKEPAEVVQEGSHEEEISKESEQEVAKQAGEEEAIEEKPEISADLSGVDIESALDSEVCETGDSSLEETMPEDNCEQAEAVENEVIEEGIEEEFIPEEIEDIGEG